MATPEYKAVVVGATGAVGSGLVRSLIESAKCTSVTLLVRRNHPEADITSNPKVKQHVVNLDDMYESAKTHVRGHDAAFSCLGVGQPSKVSKEEHYRVDVGLNTQFAKACKEADIPYIAQLSAVGSDAKSSIALVRMKGELEENIKAMKFPCAQMFQPAVILTPYDRYDTRWKIISSVYKTIDCVFPSKYKSIYASEIGAAMRAGAEAFLAARDPAGPPRFDRMEHAQMTKLAGNK
eukprot:tig00021127_g18707.t1